MKKFKKMRYLSVPLAFLLLLMMTVPTVTLAAEPTVELKTTSQFAVMAGTGISNTGSTIISGDIGVSPGSAITGFPPGTVTGTQRSNDAVTIAAQVDLVDVYNDAAGRPTTVNLTGQDLGGLTLTAGVYTFDSSAQLTGTLTLDAQGNPDAVFIIQTNSTLTTATDSVVSLINGARFCRVFWKVGSSATLGTDTKFKGHIFAMTSITANTRATVEGQLLARNGAVTLDTNTITNGFCDAIATLHVVKKVINDDGGTAIANQFSISVKTAGNNVYGSPQLGDSSVLGTTYTLLPGTYVVSEGTHVGYSASYSGDSDAGGSIVLAAGDNKTVTVTNQDNPVASSGGSTPIPPLINVIKTPDPLALTTGQGLVTYTYKVTNPGTVALSTVSVIDDKITSVNYVSGDVNSDSLLQTSETWIYTGKMNINVTTTNTVTAKGSANGMTAIDTATATVVVSGIPIVAPLINVIKTPQPLALTSGQGLVTYTYKVTNPGIVALSSVSVTDDKISSVNYVSGDVNTDNLLQANETWIYTGKMNINATTTNTATAKGSANGMTATDIAIATVVVSRTSTVMGGQLPTTATPVYGILIIGVVLTLVGAICWRSRKRYE